MAGHGNRGAGLAAVLGLGLVTTAAAADLPIDQPPINYHSAEATDPVARLDARLGRGEVRLEFDREGPGYLRSVLEELDVSPTSQTLVFSKTSFQHTRIAPRTPRALYFNDAVYVGYVKGGDLLEFAADDPELGATFYLLEQRPGGRPRLERQTETCLLCHASSKTEDVPGVLLRSIFPDRRGLPVYRAGAFVTDQTSPLEERWGGWYVTGTHGAQRHMGNVVVRDDGGAKVEIDREAGANRTDLDGLVDTFPYLTGHSDIVALMVMEHQAPMQNRITFAGYQARMARHYDDGINNALGRPEGTVSTSTESRINSAAEKLLAYLLFSGEPTLTDPVVGTSGFAEQFAARGPRDRRGRSLRDLDLKARLFRYPCSYLIYSEAFDALPAPIRDRVYARLHDVLTGVDRSPAFAHLDDDDRRAIYEILLDTKPDLPATWTTPAASGE